jgi:Ricin-type beta-trefoil lectin domain-like
MGTAAGGFMTTGSAGAVSSDDDVRADIFRLINSATDGCADLSVESPTSDEVVQEPCTDRPTQVWLAQPLQTEPYEQLVNQHSGLCMDLADVVGDGTRVVQRPCSHKLVSQQWEGVFGIVTGRPLKVVNRALGLCLEVKDGSLAAGAPLQVSTCADSVDHQTWLKITPNASRR